MKRGQIFSTDLLISLIVIVTSIALIVNGFEAYIQQTSSSIESAKMHQIALDSASIHHYNLVDGGNGFDGLNESIKKLGYNITSNKDDQNIQKSQACISSVRGTEMSETMIFICR